MRTIQLRQIVEGHGGVWVIGAEALSRKVPGIPAQWELLR